MAAGPAGAPALRRRLPEQAAEVGLTLSFEDPIREANAWIDQIRRLADPPASRAQRTTLAITP